MTEGFAESGPRRLSPWGLTWAEVDPARYPFDPAEVAAVVRGLPPAVAVPAHPPEGTDDREWARQYGAPWADAMSAALVGHYGGWVRGWRWARGEGDYDGGPVAAWCCASHTMRTPDETLAAVTAAVLDWRDWLETLARLFDRYLPLPPGDAGLDRWERAVARLVTVVARRTQADSTWYGHCEQVLSWFLTAAGVPGRHHRLLIRDAIGGRFESWRQPDRATVAEVARRLVSGGPQPDA